MDGNVDGMAEGRVVGGLVGLTDDGFAEGMVEDIEAAVVGCLTDG